MSKVLRRDEVVIQDRWQPRPFEEPELSESFVDVMPPAPDPQLIAEEIRQQAEADAALLLAQARADAEVLRQQAYDEGLAEGRAAAEQENAGFVTAANALLDEINDERDDFFTRSETELVTLAVVIAEKVLAQQLAVKPDTVVDITRTHMKRIRERETLRVRVHPDDLALLAEARPQLLGEIDGVRELQLFEDRRVGRGGVILEGPGGTFDARFTAQLDVIRRALADTREETDEPADD